MKELTIHPFEAFSDTALLLFIVDSRNFPARKSQNSMIPMPVPIVSMLPLKDTDRIPQPLFRDGIFLIACKKYSIALKLNVFKTNFEINGNYRFQQRKVNYL